MEIVLYKKTENCEKNCKQTCSKLKTANVSSVNEQVSQNIYQLSGEKNWKHEISIKCAKPVQDGVQTVKYERLNTGMAPTCNWRIKIVSN